VLLLTKTVWKTVVLVIYRDGIQKQPLYPANTNPTRGAEMTQASDNGNRSCSDGIGIVGRKPEQAEISRLLRSSIFGTPGALSSTTCC